MEMSVLLATNKREALLERTLASLALCRLPPNYRHLWVVENGARGGTEDIVTRAAPGLRARCLFETQGNKSAALNAALQHIHEGLIVFLDDDVRVAPDVLERYAAAAQERSPAFYGGPVASD